MSALRSWLEDEYTKAQQAARVAAAARRPNERNPSALEHASATARMCALGETLLRLESGDRAAPVP